MSDAKDSSNERTDAACEYFGGLSARIERGDRSVDFQELIGHAEALVTYIGRLEGSGHETTVLQSNTEALTEFVQDIIAQYDLSGKPVRLEIRSDTIELMRSALKRAGIAVKASGEPHGSGYEGSVNCAQKAEPQCSGLCQGHSSEASLSGWMPDANCPVHGIKATLGQNGRSDGV